MAEQSRCCRGSDEALTKGLRASDCLFPGGGRRGTHSGRHALAQELVSGVHGFRLLVLTGMIERVSLQPASAAVRLATMSQGSPAPADVAPKSVNARNCCVRLQRSNLVAERQTPMLLAEPKEFAGVCVSAMFCALMQHM